MIAKQWPRDDKPGNERQNNNLRHVRAFPMFTLRWPMRRLTSQTTI